MNTDLLSALSPMIAFAFATCATPGPNNAMVASSGATFGFRPTIPHMLGVATGFPAMLAVVALGGGQILREYPAIHVILKWVGAAYMLWLAFHIATAEPALSSDTDNHPPRGGKPLSFLQAVLFQWVNPKAWIIALGAVTTYTNPNGVVGQAMLLALVFLPIGVLTIVLWAMTGIGAARLLRSRRAIRGFNIAMAALLVASLLPILAAG
jgi:threonine/homoserine/homoserine lactone efflux protein